MNPEQHHGHDDDDRDLKRKLDHIEALENVLIAESDLILESINQLVNLLTRKLTQGKVQITMKTIAVGETSLATLALLDQNGSTMTIDSTYTVTYSAATPADVTLGTPNADGSATLTGVNADAGDVIGASVTRPDGVVITLTPDTLVITGGAGGQVLTSGAVVLT